MSRLGEYIELIDNRNSDRSIIEVKGINISKEFIPTVVDAENLDIEKYKIVKPNEFAYSGMQTGRDNAIRVVLNESKETFIISPAYLVFKVIDENTVLSKYLMIYFKRFECDRRGAFMSDGSIRSNLDWDRFCDIEINVPSIEIQKKYVAIYDAMKRNLKAYETGLEDLKLVCDGYIEKLKREYPLEKLERFIKRYDIRNSENKIKNVKGVSTSKEFREPTSKVNINELSNYKIVKPGTFSYVLTTHNEKVFAYALNDTKENIVVTSVNEVFETNKEKLLPEYLSLFFNRTEFDRYARFNSWGSARETFNWEDLIQVSIPVPDISIQKSIVSIYKIYKSRKMFRNKMKSIINNICSVLIKSSLSE